MPAHPRRPQRPRPAHAANAAPRDASPAAGLHQDPTSHIQHPVDPAQLIGRADPGLRPPTSATQHLTEAQLTEIWRGRRFPEGALVTRAGVPVTVVYQGRPGRGPGPDFRGAVVRGPSGLTLRGDVELHVRSSSFRAHGHAADPAYANVVLHVVFEDDTGVDTPLYGGGSSPVVALAPWVARREGELRRWLERPLLWREPCHDAAERLGVEAVGAALDAEGNRRFDARVARFAERIESAGMEQALYESLLEALGYGGNGAAMLALATALPWHLLDATALAVARQRAAGGATMEDRGWRVDGGGTPGDGEHRPPPIDASTDLRGAPVDEPTDLRPATTGQTTDLRAATIDLRPATTGQTTDPRPATTDLRPATTDQTTDLRPATIDLRPERALAFEALLLGAGGLLPSQRGVRGRADPHVEHLERVFAASGLPALAAGSWKLWGVRPANAPARRIAGAASLLAAHGSPSALLALAAAGSVDDALAPLLPRADGYWLTHHDTCAPACALPPAFIGRSRALEILQNVVLPAAAAAGDPALASNARRIFARLPRPSSYGVTRFLENALRSSGARLPLGARRAQGLLALHRDWCTQGGCGRCPLSG